MKKNDSKVNFGLAESYNSFGELLQTVRKNAGLSAKQIAEQTGVHSNSQGKYEKQRDPGIDYLVRYANAVGIPFWQLLCRRIEMGKASNDEKSTVLNEVGPLIKHFGERYQGYQVSEPGADYNEVEHSSNYQLLSACLTLIDRFQGNDNITIIEHDGNSMAPTINAGDPMLVDTSVKELTEGDVFIFKFGKNSLAKRVQFLPAGGVMLKPDNPQYQPTDVNNEDIDSLDIQGKLVSSICFY